MFTRRIFALSLALTLAISLSPAEAAGPRDRAAVYTPSKSSAKRRAALDVLRAYLRKNHQIQAIFVVSAFRVQNDWAWISAEPRSADGKSRYEPISAVLRKQRNRWSVVDVMDYDDPDRDERALVRAFHKRLKAKYPSLPAGIFPK